VANRLEGKVAALRAGDQGIGRRLWNGLAAEGAECGALFPLQQAGADEVVASVQKGGRKAAAFPVRCRESCGRPSALSMRRLVSWPHRYLGEQRGAREAGRFLGCHGADYDTVLDVNLKGPFFVTQAFVKHRMQAKLAAR